MSTSSSDRERVLSSDSALNELHGILVRWGHVRDADFWDCVDEFDTSTRSGERVGQKGRDTQFSDVNKDEPVFDGITDSFAGTVTLKCYLDDAFRNEVFVRHPNIYLAFKKFVPDAISKEKFWSDYCRWALKMPQTDDYQTFHGLNFTNCVESERTMTSDNAEKILAQVEPPCDMTIMFQLQLFRGPMQEFYFSPGYGGLDTVAAGEGGTSKATLKCEFRNQFQPYARLGDLKPDRVVQKLNRHGNLVVDLNRHETVAWESSSKPCLSVSLSLPPAKDYATHRLGEMDGLEAFTAPGQIGKIQKMNKRRKVEVAEWQPACQSAAPSATSAQRVLANCGAKTQPAGTQAGASGEVAGTERAGEYTGVEKLLAWFWKLRSDSSQSAAKRRERLMDSVENFIRTVEEREKPAPTKNNGSRFTLAVSSSEAKPHLDHLLGMVDKARDAHKASP